MKKKISAKENIGIRVPVLFLLAAAVFFALPADVAAGLPRGVVKNSRQGSVAENDAFSAERFLVKPRLRRASGEGAGRTAVASGEYYFGDALQSVHQVTGPAGAVLRQTFTDAWGNNIPLSPTPPPPTGPGDRHGFQGREHDNESGLMHFRARSYDPMTGRFTSRDPVWHSNLYHFPGNDPVNMVDPSGQDGILSQVWDAVTDLGGWKEDARRAWNNGQMKEGLHKGVLMPTRDAALIGAAGGTSHLRGAAAWLVRNAFAGAAYAGTEEAMRVGFEGEDFDAGRMATEGAIVAGLGMSLEGIVVVGGRVWAFFRESNRLLAAELKVATDASKKVLTSETKVTIESVGKLQELTREEAALFQEAMAGRAGAVLPENEIVVRAGSSTSNSFKLRMPHDYQPLPGVTAPGKSGSLAMDLTVGTEIPIILRRPAQAGDLISGAFVGDIRRAGFKVILAPTTNPRHVRIIAGAREFDEAGREALSKVFEVLDRFKR